MRTSEEIAADTALYDSNMLALSQAKTDEEREALIHSNKEIHARELADRQEQRQINMQAHRHVIS